MLFLSRLTVVIKLAAKGRVLGLFSLSMLLLILFSVLSAVFSARQPATVAMDVGVSFIRLAVPLVILSLVYVLIWKEFDKKYCFLSLTLPWSRFDWLLSRLVVVWLFGVVLSLSLFFLLGCVVAFVSGWYAQATHVSLGGNYYFLYAAQLLDFSVLCVFFVFMAVVSRSVGFFIFGSFGFLLISRSFGFVLELLRVSPWLVGESGGEYRQGVFLLTYMLPDLGALDVRAVALYDSWRLLSGAFWYSVFSAIFYVVLFSLFSFFFFDRKRID